MLERVTAELLAETFLSKRFLENLSEASKITNETYNETGFFSCWDTSSEEISIGQVSEGNYLGMKTEGLNDAQRYPSLSGILLVDLHTHPIQEGPVVPSDEDLYLVMHRDEKNVYDNKTNRWMDLRINPICAIGKVGEKRNVELLLYNANGNLHEGDIESVDRKIIEYLDKNGIDAYEEYISKSNIKTSEIKRLMEDSGHYNAEILQYSPEIHVPGGRNEFRESNLNKFRNKLKKFEYEIRYSDSDTSFIDSLGFR